MDRVEEVKKEQRGNHSVGEMEDSHPAFGMIEMSRVTSSGEVAMFGANTSYHPTFMRLSIKKAIRTHGLDNDYYFARKTLIEIDLTPLQFADLLTHMNYGSGIPCTLRRTAEGGMIPEIPITDKRETGRIVDGFKERLKNKLSEEKLKVTEDRIEEILAKKTINKGDRAELKDLMFQVTRVMKDSVPFAMKQFGESADKVQVEIKKEASAFINLVTEQAGIKALSSMGVKEQVELLDSIGLQRGDKRELPELKGRKKGEDDEAE